MADWLELKGKVYIVTGGTHGIGESIVNNLLELGAKVANFDVQLGNKKHENYLFLQTDISSQVDVEKSVAEVIEKFKRIDGVINNAGILIPRLLVDPKQKNSTYELTEDVFEKMLNINLKGTYLVSQAVSRILIKQGGGVIINMTSESGLEGSEGQSVYAATKAAQYSFTRSWSKELGKYNIRVVGIAPGIMEATALRTLAYEEALAYTRNITVDELRAGYSKTATIPLGRSGKLDEVANLVSFYLSDKASYITGVTTNVAGGKTRG